MSTKGRWLQGLLLFRETLGTKSFSGLSPASSLISSLNLGILGLMRRKLRPRRGVSKCVGQWDSGPGLRATFITPTRTNGQKNAVSKDQPEGGGEWRQKGLSPAQKSAQQLSRHSLPPQIGGEETDHRSLHRVCHGDAPCSSPWTGLEAPLTVWKVCVCPASIRLPSLHTLEEPPGLRPPPRY